MTDLTAREVEVAAVRAGQEVIVGADHKALCHPAQRDEDGRRQELVPVVQMVNRAGRIVLGDPLADHAGGAATVKAAHEGGPSTFQKVAASQSHELDPLRGQPGIVAGVAGDQRYGDAATTQLLERCKGDCRCAPAWNAIVIDDNDTVYWSRHGEFLAPGATAHVDLGSPTAIDL